MQMGHDTQNLIGERGLEGYSGFVLSPLNRNPDELRCDIKKMRGKRDYDIVLDAQLYFPHSRRGQLSQHPYFPDDFDTADLASMEWWFHLNDKIIKYAIDLGVDSIASPVQEPKLFSLDYYSQVVACANHLAVMAKNEFSSIYTTVMVDSATLSEKENMLRLSSLLSQSETDGFYIVFKHELEPRRELMDESELISLLGFVNELKRTNKTVFIAFSSSDMLLFKYVNADHCGTGKFFNLRRFTKSRYEEQSSGGGQLPYWFEHSLLAFIRQPDISRMIARGYAELIGCGFSNNDWSSVILEQIKEHPEQPWVATSWRHYLTWFTLVERELDSADRKTKVGNWLVEAERNWLKLEEKGVLMDERRNDGSWIRCWRQVVSAINTQ